MKHLSDIENAQTSNILPIVKIAEKLGIDIDLIEMYGKYKEKLPLSLINHDKVKNSESVLGTAIMPTTARGGLSQIAATSLECETYVSIWSFCNTIPNLF